MYYAVIQRPNINTADIQKISKEYDPYFGLVGPHITLVFPVSSEKIKEEILKNHIKKVAQTIKRFLVQLNGLELAWDQWLFLTPQEGRNHFVALHDGLYTDILKPWLRSDIPYVPHIALGHFAIKDNEYNLKDPKALPLDEAKYEAAKKKLAKINLDYTYTVANIELITVNDEFTKSETIAEFELKT